MPPPPEQHHAQIWPYVWMLLGSLCFAVMSTLAHAAGKSCDWQVVAIARTALALIFAAGLAFGAKRQFVFLRPAALWMRIISGEFAAEESSQHVRGDLRNILIDQQ